MNINKPNHEQQEAIKDTGERLNRGIETFLKMLEEGADFRALLTQADVMSKRLNSFVEEITYSQKEVEKSNQVQ
jgi:hypothetical protein